MAGPILNSCCLCQSLRTGSIINGILGIICSILTIFAIIFIKADFKTLLFDFLPQSVIRIFLIVNLCMTIIISILMIVGVVKRNYYLMLPWVVLGFVLIFGLLITVIYTAVVAFIDGATITGIYWLVFGLLWILIYTYIWMVVYSYFAIIKEETDRGRYSKQPYRR